MAIVDVGIHPDSGKATLDKDKFSYSKSYRVISNSFGDDEVTIAAAPGIPTMYSPHPEFHFAVVKSISASRDPQASTVWKVDVTWETPSNKDKDDKDDQHSDPKQDLPIVTWNFENYQVAAVESDNPFMSAIVNSANEVFDPVPQMDKSRIIITIKKNYDVASGVEQQVMLFHDTINLDTWWGFMPGQVKCQGAAIDGIKMRQQAQGGVIYYLEVTWTFACLPQDTWNLTLLDVGSYYNDANGKPQEFLTTDGHPRLGFLDGRTGAISPDDAPHYIAPIRIYINHAFGSLNLPQSFAAALQMPV